MTEEYLTVYRGGRDQRRPRPFSVMEEKEITRLTYEDYASLENMLVSHQRWGRFQRLVQEAIERKRYQAERSPRAAS